MRRKRSIATIKRECKKLWGKVILERNPVCIVCRRATATQPHHIFPRSRYRHLHYDLRNGAALCVGDHYRIHHDPVIPVLRLKEELGDRFMSLAMDAQTGRRNGPYKRQELENIRIALQAALEET